MIAEVRDRINCFSSSKLPAISGIVAISQSH